MNGTIKLAGLDGAMAMLAQLPAEIVSKRGGPVLAALKAGARIIMAQEKLTLQKLIDENRARGEDESTGLLMSSMAITRGKEPSDGNGERVLIRFKRKTYARKGKPVTVYKTAQIFEYGKHDQPPRSFIRSSFNAKAEEAIKAVEADLLARVDRIVAKLAAANKGK